MLKLNVKKAEFDIKVKVLDKILKFFFLRKEVLQVANREHFHSLS